MTVTGEHVRVHHGARGAALHRVLAGPRERAIDPMHYAGVAAAKVWAPGAPIRGSPAHLRSAGAAAAAH